MLNNELIVLYQFEDSVKIYSNAYYYGYSYIEYYPLNQEPIKTRLTLTDVTVTISDLTPNTYSIYAIDSNENTTEPIEVTVYDETFGDYLEDVLGDDYEAITNNVTLNYDNLIPSYYDVMTELSSENDKVTEYGIFLDKLDNIIEDLNSRHNYLNDDNGINFYCTKSHVLIVECDDTNYFEDKISIEVSKYSDGAYTLKKYWKNNDSEKYIARFETGLYRIDIYKEDCLVRVFYFYSDGLDSDQERYLEEIETINNKKTKKITANSNIPDDWEYYDDDEENIFSNLYTLNKKTALFARPELVFLDDEITVDVNDAYSFISMLEDVHTYYLCGYTEKDIYKSIHVPRKVKITAREFSFFPDKLYFRNEPYYFYIADEDNNMISEVTYIDLTESKYTEDDSGDINIEVDYNERYAQAMLQQYQHELYSVIMENKPEIWDTVRNTLSNLSIGEELGYALARENFLQEMLNTWNERYGNIVWIIYYIFLCDQRYYTDLDRQLYKDQNRYDTYRTHEIPAGNYILQVFRINGETELIEYGYKPTENISFRIDKDDYLAFRCISLETDSLYKVSDFGYYNNTEYGTNYIYNSLEVEEA